MPSRQECETRNIPAGDVLTLMPLDAATYYANAEKCEERAREMPPGLRRDLLMAARQWRKLTSVSEKRVSENEPSNLTTPPASKQQ